MSQGDSEIGNGKDWLFFFDAIHPLGFMFHVTVRQGAGTQELKDAFDAQETCISLMKERGYRGPWNKTTEPASDKPQKEPTPAKGQTAQAHQAAVNARNKWSLPLKEETSGNTPISLLKITGDKESPVVEMYSPSPKVKFPVFKCPAHILSDILKHDFGENTDTSKLFDCGSKVEISWMVGWIRSEKDPKYVNVARVAKVKKEWSQ